MDEGERMNTPWGSEGFVLGKREICLDELAILSWRILKTPWGFYWLFQHAWISPKNQDSFLIIRELYTTDSFEECFLKVLYCFLPLSSICKISSTCFDGTYFPCSTRISIVMICLAKKMPWTLTSHFQDCIFVTGKTTQKETKTDKNGQKRTLPFCRILYLPHINQK